MARIPGGEGRRDSEIAGTGEVARGRARRWAILICRELWLPAAWLVFCLLFSPFTSAFQLDSDEGFNLMKAMLLADGHELYSEIWSDQPPLFTYALACLIKVFGNSVNAARVLVLVSSCALIWAACRAMRTIAGEVHAIACGLLIILLPHYAKLSVSVMVGLPAITLAVASLALLLMWKKQRRLVWLVLSGLLLGLSVATKAFTGFLVIVPLGALLLSERLRAENTNWRERLSASGVWAGSLGCVLLFVLLVCVGPGNLKQLVYSHMAGRKALGASYTLYKALLDVWPLLALAGIGGVYSLVARRWWCSVFSAWVLAAIFLLSKHRPVWYHHQLLVSVPAALLGGFALGQTCLWVRAAAAKTQMRLARALSAVPVLVVLAWLLICQAPLALERYSAQSVPVNFRGAQPSGGQPALEMARWASQTKWVITDRPMYPFRAGLRTPPFLAVTSQKRLLTGFLSQHEITRVIRKYHPEQILIMRRPWPIVARHVSADYDLVIENGRTQLYVLKTLTTANP
jgi:Dolichyl-phosphate-mannose-protein mannosyltransferase